MTIHYLVKGGVVVRLEVDHGERIVIHATILTTKGEEGRKDTRTIILMMMRRTNERSDIQTVTQMMRGAGGNDEIVTKTEAVIEEEESTRMTNEKVDAPDLVKTVNTQMKRRTSVITREGGLDLAKQVGQKLTLTMKSTDVVAKEVERETATTVTTKTVRGDADEAVRNVAQLTLTTLMKMTTVILRSLTAAVSTLTQTTLNLAARVMTAEVKERRSFDLVRALQSLPTPHGLLAVQTQTILMSESRHSKKK